MASNKNLMLASTSRRKVIMGGMALASATLLSACASKGKDKGYNPCNPCAAKNPCNPCNPCAAKKNPCAAS